MAPTQGPGGRPTVRRPMVKSPTALVVGAVMVCLGAGSALYPVLDINTTWLVAGSLVAGGVAALGLLGLGARRDRPGRTPPSRRLPWSR